MGYLSQRKKNEREKVFLQISAVVLGFFSIAAFCPWFPESLQNGLFHLYLVNLGIFLLALFFERYGYAFFLALLLVLNYFHLASSANIFMNVKVVSEHSLDISYLPEMSFELSATDGTVLSRRRLQLASGTEVPVITIEKGGHVFSLLRVNFASLKSSEREGAFRQLKAFVVSQDDPVIVFGNFGEPVWADNLKKFLVDTGLQVKNRLLLTQPGCRFGLFSAPSFYILAFSNVGINELSAKFPNGKNYPEVNAELGFF